MLKLTDATGKVLAFNDDHEDIGSGMNTHHADSYLTAKLPADGIYYVHLGDTARNGGEEYAYRLRISAAAAGFRIARGALQRQPPQQERAPTSASMSSARTGLTAPSSWA